MVILLSVAGCGARTVTTGEIAGIWTVAESSRDKLSADARRGSARFVFELGGSFSATEIPRDLLYDDAGETLTGQGAWKIVSDRGGPYVALSFRSISRGSRGTIPYGTQLFVDGRGSTRRLFYYRGDPDLRDIVYFEKR